jgi:uncharacterized membrane protein YhaH (DUF805 family)
VRLIPLWFGLREPVSRRAYAASGFGLMALKYVVEAEAIRRVTGRSLSPLVFLNPLLGARGAVLSGHDWLVWALALWTLPFLWIGVSMTLRRAEDAGRSPFLALLYFLPVVNYLLMLTLCLLPSRTRAESERRMQATPGAREGWRGALIGMGVGALLALAMVGASVLAFGFYGTTLFVGTPFVMGALSAFVFNQGGRRDLGATLLVALGSVALAGGAILLFALEGALCLAMAAPLAMALAVMGAILGRVLAVRTPLQPARVMALALPLPLLAGVDRAQPPPRAREVLSVVEIAAPPAAVWPKVVSFAALEEPPGWVFRLGIAYPLRATISGRGVGAVRRCEFSTGAFVEPITAWDEPRHLGFSVSEQPPPMQEWSPYRHVTARHLDGYLRVRSGEFRLVALPGGRTRLEGRTRYAMHVFPAAYWNLWSDALIHVIHERVLEHIQREVMMGHGASGVVRGLAGPGGRVARGASAF